MLDQHKRNSGYDNPNKRESTVAARAYSPRIMASSVMESFSREVMVKDRHSLVHADAGEDGEQEIPEGPCRAEVQGLTVAVVLGEVEDWGGGGRISGETVQVQLSLIS